VSFKPAGSLVAERKTKTASASALFCSVRRARSQAKDVSVLLIDFQGFGDNSGILSPAYNVIFIACI
jgi:hypothetical protein